MTTIKFNKAERDLIERGFDTILPYEPIILVSDSKLITKEGLKKYFSVLSSLPYIEGREALTDDELKLCENLIIKIYNHCNKIGIKL